MARVIVVTSGKGGVGKTSITANLGMHLANKNFRTLVIDMDIGLNNLDVSLGLEQYVDCNLADYVLGKCRLKQCMVQDDVFPLLYLVSSGNFDFGMSLSLESMGNIIAEFREMFDYILIDCPAGIDAGFVRSVKYADEAIIVTTSHLGALKDADIVVNLLNGYNITDIKFVLNRVRGDLVMDKLMLDVYDIQKALNVEFLGVIPEDDKLQIASVREIKKLSSKYAFDRAFFTLTDNLVTGSKKLFDCTYKYKGILGGIKKRLKRKY